MAGRGRAQTVWMIAGAAAAMALGAAGCSEEKQPAASTGTTASGASNASAAPGAGSHEGVFSAGTLEEAKDKAAKADPPRLVVVDFTASWCPPCMVMDQTTWKDPKVGEWFASKAVGVQVDVDKHKAIARDMKVNAMPTVIVLKDGKEIGREVGLQNAEQLLKWLNGLTQ